MNTSDTSRINTTYSDLILMIGGQLLILFILSMVTLFGVDAITLPLPASTSFKAERARLSAS